jgi:hypothetical protein
MMIGTWYLAKGFYFIAGKYIKLNIYLITGRSD